MSHSLLYLSLPPTSVPEGVLTPNATIDGATASFAWLEPTLPNGEITRYMLYLNGTQVYVGTALSASVADIDIYEEHWYYLEACTSVGCGRSPNGTIAAAVFVGLVVQPVIFTRLVIGVVIACIVLAVGATLLFLCALKRWHHFVSKSRVKLSILSHDFSLEHTYAVSVTACSKHVVFNVFAYISSIYFIYICL